MGQSASVATHRERTYISLDSDSSDEQREILEGLEARGFKMIASGINLNSGTLVMVWEGDDIIKTTRKMIEATDQAAIGTFHSSDSIEAANREIALWFTPSEMVEYEKIRRELNSSTPKEESSRSAMRIAGIVAGTAVVGAAIAAGVIFAKRQTSK